MTVEELIEKAKRRVGIFGNYKHIDIYDLISEGELRKGRYKVEIASGTIQGGGYIEYTTWLNSLPSVGEVILMHGKYVGKVDKIKFDTAYYDAEIWLKTAYCLDDKGLSSELRRPTFDAGTND